LFRQDGTQWMPGFLAPLEMTEMKLKMAKMKLKMAKMTLEITDQPRRGRRG
jgi:hypothetical protein